MKPEVIMEQYPYRFVQCGTLEINGKTQTIVSRSSTTGPNGILTCICLTTPSNSDYCLEDPEYTKYG